MDQPVCSNDRRASNWLPCSGTTIQDEDDAGFKFISEMLMEEDVGTKADMFQDCLALQAFEKSFYDALGQNYPSCPNHTPPACFDPKNSVVNSFNSDDHCTATVTGLPDSNWVQGASYSCFPSSSSSSDSNDRPAESGVILSSTFPIGSQSFGHVIGIEEGNDELEPNDGTLEALVLMPNKVRSVQYSSYGSSNGRKNRDREESDDLEEARTSKQSAILSSGEEELSQMFDKVLLYPDNVDQAILRNNNNNNNNATEVAAEEDEANKKKGRRASRRGNKRQGSKMDEAKEKKTEVVDLTTLLTQCAQAVASNDHRAAGEQLKQIRKHSSPRGNGSQRLAHYFANGLEARLAGTMGKAYFSYASLVATRRTAADILKAYHVYMSACPFRKLANMYSNRAMARLAQNFTELHIIDFGILYGFQWPCLIQRLSKRPGGPPKLRITGIELPQPGFRPKQGVEETGRRLESYCKRFNVPFQYDAIAQKWETITLEDLKIERAETGVLVVNCLQRFKNLLDETVILDSPRDAVLNLIKGIKPHMFIQSECNGTHNAPFFLARFREALFHYSGLFDMFDACASREDEGRIMYEREIFGKDAVNVIACEGSERVERPETYKQWQVRNVRAGFKQLPLNQGILSEVKTKLKVGYHRDFVVLEDAHWMLQGWKGRIFSALSCWKPV